MPVNLNVTARRFTILHQLRRPGSVGAKRIGIATYSHHQHSSHEGLLSLFRRSNTKPGLIDHNATKPATTYRAAPHGRRSRTFGAASINPAKAHTSQRRYVIANPGNEKPELVGCSSGQCSRSYTSAATETKDDADRPMSSAPFASSVSVRRTYPAAYSVEQQSNKIDALAFRSIGFSGTNLQEDTPQTLHSVTVEDDILGKMIDQHQLQRSQLSRRTVLWERLYRQMLQFATDNPAEEARSTRPIDYADTGHENLHEGFVSADLEVQDIQSAKDLGKTFSHGSPMSVEDTKDSENPRQFDTSARPAATFSSSIVATKQSDVSASAVGGSEEMNGITFYETLSRMLSEQEWDLASKLYMEKRGLAGVNDTAILNQILASIVKRRKRTFFVPIRLAINFVHEFQVTPDWLTWALMLRLAPSAALKQQMLRTLHVRGLFDHTTAPITFSAAIVHYSLKPFLNRGGSPSAFIETLFGIYGHLWVNEEAVSAFVEVLVEFSAFDEIVQLLQHLSEGGYYNPNVSLMNHLLRWCRRNKNVERAVQFLRVFKDLWAVGPDAESIDILFKLAEQERYFNVTRVAWKYACFGGKTSKGASRVMSRLLNNALCKPTAPGTRRWKAMAGFVITGTRPPKMHKYKKVASYVNTLLQDEKSVGMRYRPAKEFADCVNDALELDGDWARTGKRYNGSLESLLMSAIPIQRIIRKDADD